MVPGANSPLKTAPNQYQVNSPLHRLPVRKKGPEASDALKGQGAKAPVVDSHSVLLLLQQLWGLKYTGGAAYVALFLVGRAASS